MPPRRTSDDGVRWALLHVTARRGNGPAITWARQVRFYYTGMGQGMVDAFEREQRVTSSPDIYGPGPLCRA
jgi:hypothetical protein